jgi:hypothetical protein
LVYSAGFSCVQGQLGQGENITDLARPKLVEGLSDVIKINARGDSSFAVTSMLFYMLTNK